MNTAADRPGAVRRAWWAAAPVAVLAVVAVQVPSAPLQSAIEVVAFGLALAAIRSAIRARPTVLAAWYGLAGTMAAFSASSLAEIVEIETGSAVADALEAGFDVTGYVSVGLAALATLATGRRRHDRDAWLDAVSLVLAACLAVGAWAGAPDIGRGSTELNVAMPLLTAVVLLVCVPLAAPGNGRTTSGTALLAAGALTLVGYGARTVEFSDGTTRFFESLPLLAIAAVTLAARHPSVVLFGRRESAGVTSAARVLGLGASLLVSPGLVILMAVGSGRTAWLIGAGTAVLTGLTLWRLSRLTAERERARAAVAAGEARLRVLLENAADVIAIVDGDGRFSYVSPAMTGLLGVPAEDHVGRPALGLVDPRDTERLLASVGLGEDGRPVPRQDGGAARGVDVRLRHSDGTVRWVEAKVSDRIDAPGVEGWVVNLREVTDRKDLEAELRRRAGTDALTGLANRASFMAALETGAAAAVLFVDLDDFKQVNDSHGHAAGDQLLVAVARRLASSTREDDLVARLGGDEFAVLLPEADGARLRQVADRIVDELGHAVQLDAGLLPVTASVGGALAAPGDAGETLLHRADTAMYLAKREGKNTFVLLDADDSPASVRAATPPGRGASRPATVG